VGKDKTTTSTEQRSTQTVTPSAEETELNRLQLEREKFLDPQIRGVQSQGLSLVQQLLQGDENLPGFLGELPGGISPEVTSDIVQQSLRDIAPSFQRSGLLDSGVRASIEARTAGDIRRTSEEFNIGNRLNLLNLALSGQAQIQQPILGFSGQLGQRLAGLRNTASTGFTNQTTLSANPFLKSFQQGAGSALGKGLGAGAAGFLF